MADEKPKLDPTLLREACDAHLEHQALFARNQSLPLGEERSHYGTLSVRAKLLADEKMIKADPELKAGKEAYEADLAEMNTRDAKGDIQGGTQKGDDYVDKSAVHFKRLKESFTKRCGPTS